MFATNPVSKSDAVALPQQKGITTADIQRHVSASANLNRDPMLVAFEGYMLKRLRTSDVCLIENVLHFNVNQCAYIIEGSITKDQMTSTLKRVRQGLQNMIHVKQRVPPSNRGVYIINVTQIKTMSCILLSVCIGA
jgi:hypothetical protein